MATANIGYAADTALITVTLSSLATASMRESSMIDNTSNKYLDAQMQIVIPMQASTSPGIGSDKAIYVYFYGGVKPGQLTYPVTGTDAAVTVSSAGNLIGPFVIAITNNSTYKTTVTSVASFFGGYLPPYWGTVFYNMASASIGGEATISYLGITEVVA